MKKNLLAILLLAMLSLPTMGAITPPYFGVFVGIKGASYVARENALIKSRNDFGISQGIELMLGNNVFFYGHFSALIPLLSSAKDTFSSTTDFNLGGGVGYRLLDYREADKGHLLITSLTLSGGLAPFGILEIAGTKSLYFPSVSIGGELFLNYYYHAFRNFALRAGINFGAFMTEYKNEDPYTINNIISEKGLSLTYGISIGLAF